MFCGSVGFLMTMTGHEREAARVVAGAALANVALNAALVPPFGLSGAAVATAVSLVGWNAVLLTRARTRLGIVPTVLGR